MNDSGAALPKFEIPVGNPDVIMFLEQMLREARSGSVVGLGVVKVNNVGQIEATVVGAVALPVIYTGAALLQQGVLAQMTGRPSPILKVR